MNTDKLESYLDLAHKNLRDTIRHRIKNIDGGKIYETDNYMLFTIGMESTDGHLNGVLSFNDNYAVEIFKEAKRFFDNLGYSYSFWIRDKKDYSLEDILLSKGFEPKRRPGSSVMVIDKKIKDIDLPEHYSFLEVQSLNEVKDFSMVIKDAFDKSEDVVAKLFSPKTLLYSDKVKSFLIYNDKGKPVSAAITSISKDVAGIYYIATIESERSKGLGKFITQEATNAGFYRNKNIVILQASELGEFVYEKLGYEKISVYRSYNVNK